MITGTLEELKNYGGVNKGFVKAYELIKNSTAKNEEDGRYESENGIYYLVLTYDGKEKEEGKFETHNKYIDVQYIVSGIELMQVIPKCRCGKSEGYDAEKDLEFYEDTFNVYDLVAKSGEFYIFMPDDAHKPSLELPGNPKEVKKIVVKVPV